MANYVFIAQSLDGYIAGPNGEIDWLDEIENPDGSDFGYGTFIEKIDALLMGRNSFETVLSFDFWPYKLPVLVASNTLKSVPVSLDGKAFLVSGTPNEMVHKAAQDGYENLYIDGGLLIQSFLAEGMIDEITVTTIPVILGGGIALFGELPKRVKLELVDSEMLVGQLVKSTYEIRNENA